MRPPAAAGEEEEGTKGSLMFFKLLLTGILAATLASAQRGGGGRGASSGSVMPMGNTPDKLAILTDNLKLSKDQDEIDKLVKSDADIESQMAGIEMKAFAKIYQELDKDQQPRARILFQM